MKRASGSEEENRFVTEVRLTETGAVLSIQPLPTGLHTLALEEKQSACTQHALGYRRTPAGGAGAVAGWGQKKG